MSTNKFCGGTCPQCPLVPPPMSDLSSRIDRLQAQELELATQIKSTSKALESYTDTPKSQNISRKSNVVVYGIEECPPNTAKSVSGTNAVSKACSMNVHIESHRIVDCFRLDQINLDHDLFLLNCSIQLT